MNRYASRYQRKIALGLCRSGGCTSDPVPGKVLCARCLDHRKQYNRRNGYVLLSATPPRGYVSARDAAKALGVWWNSIYRWQRQGAPHCRRYGRIWYCVERLQSWRDSRNDILPTL